MKSIAIVSGGMDSITLAYRLKADGYNLHMVTFNYGQRHNKELTYAANACKELNVAEKRPYTARYIGSLVSDFHRNMIKGGIYLYPQSSKNPNGKLRLLYECNPMAFLAEQANALASDGFTRIMDIKPTELHQRVPFICGSKNMVEKAEEFMRDAE